tara:strand:- start:281 stop:442 length:162 start_codon:yes stop_codon:yes gene_type:complete
MDLNEEELGVLFDIVNVYDPNDIKDIFPEMGSPEFMEVVHILFKKLRAELGDI